VSAALGPHTISVVRAGTKPSDYGTTLVLDWDAGTLWDVEGCSVQPTSAPEFTQDRDAVLVRWVAWLPIDADVRATDRVIFDGETYDIDGEPMRWSFGALAHQVINLRRSSDEAV
jgi:hypothetical protein